MIKKKVKNQDPRATRQTGRAPAEPHCLGNIPLSLWCPSPRIPEVGLDGPGLHPALLHSCWPFLQAAETCMKSFVCLTLPSIPIFRQIFLFSWSVFQCACLSQGKLKYSLKRYPVCYLSVALSTLPTHHGSKPSTRTWNYDRDRDYGGVKRQLSASQTEESTIWQLPGVTSREWSIYSTLLHGLEKNTQ